MSRGAALLTPDPRTEPRIRYVIRIYKLMKHPENNFMITEYVDHYFLFWTTECAHPTLKSHFPECLER